MDVDIYSSEQNMYGLYQATRPDYTPSIEELIWMTRGHCESCPTVVEFCSGPGESTHKFASAIRDIDSVTLIDIDEKFLEIARDSKIQARSVEFICGDVLEIIPTIQADVVLATFSYHHIPDVKKMQYIEKAKEWLKPKGVVALAEIYLDSQEQTREYYEKLWSSIPEEQRSEGLGRFLLQTAESEDFEFKVSKSSAENQWNKHFRKKEERKIWPTTNFPENAGTFVQIWQRQ